VVVGGVVVVVVGGVVVVVGGSVVVVVDVVVVDVDVLVDVLDVDEVDVLDVDEVLVVVAGVSDDESLRVAMNSSPPIRMISRSRAMMAMSGPLPPPRGGSSYCSST
jgi:hypothetical protein